MYIHSIYPIHSETFCVKKHILEVIDTPCLWNIGSNPDLRWRRSDLLFMKRLGAGAFGAVNLVEPGDFIGLRKVEICDFQSLSTYLLELQIAKIHCMYMYTVSLTLCVQLYIFVHVFSNYVCISIYSTYLHIYL